MKIVADDKIPNLKGVFEPYAKVVYKPGKDIVKSDVQDADVLIVRTRTKCNEELLKGTKIKMVATATIGTDHMDLAWLESAGIKWCNAPGCNSGSVRQYIASLLSHLILGGTVPSETTVGIVGVGMVGSKIETLARTLGFKVLLNDPPRQRREGGTGFCDLPELLRNSDIVTFHTPLNREGPDISFHLLNGDTLYQLKEGAIVINSSRGEVTDTQTMLEGLEKGKISRLALDVWENEPNIEPALHQKVWIGTPHIAGYSLDGKANGTIMTVHAIAEEFGLPLTQWQPESLAMPPFPLIKLAGNNEEPYITAARAILSSYNILDDDARLRAKPDEFEKQRGAYPLRREFHVWKIAPHANSSAAEIAILKNLGFQIK